jgi:hypothetical protein
LGAGCAATGWNAHHLRPSSSDIPWYCGAAAAMAGAVARGSAAPRAIHCSKSASTASGSLPLGGICASGSL